MNPLAILALSFPVLARRLVVAAGTLAGLCAAEALPAATTRLPLAGEWRFAIDRGDAGVAERWFDRDLPDRIQLPGILQAQGFGDEISPATPWVLSLYDREWALRAEYASELKPGAVRVPFLCQPPRHYLGAAWYQRDVDIPAEWAGRQVTLLLERTRWESTVWLDDRPVGSNNSLVAPHEHVLGRLSPGRHRLTIRVDNRLLLPYRPDAHAVSDSLGGSWNGIVGDLALIATTPVWIDDAQVYPDVARKTARIKVVVGNVTGEPGRGLLAAGGVNSPVAWDATGARTEFEVPLGPDAPLWDEFHPVLQQLTLTLTGDGADDRRELTFGLREFRTEGTEFLINGRPTLLRGTHHGGDFPLTGYPPTDLNYWRKLLRTCREWGLNHLRFHSFCPPDAAFTAADEIGFFLQPEPGMWNDMNPGTAVEKMLYLETDRMLRAYGNHPSFVLFSAGNEPGGRWKETLPPWVAYGRRTDPRHLYTTGTGWALLATPGPIRDRVDYLAVHRFDRPLLMRGPPGWFGRDYRRSTAGLDVPNLVHEMGQWCAYPDFDVIRKYTGYLRPGNFAIFRDSAAAHGVLDRNAAFARASGRFQLLCYKEEIEAVLRTPGLGGFQLLDLHDYTGQGTALVGVLDPFWEPKGDVTAGAWRRFCDTTVPLARLTRRMFTTDETLEVPVELAHYGPAPLHNTVVRWRVVDTGNRSVAAGAWPARDFPLGRHPAVGTVTLALAALPAPAAYRLVVSVDGTPHENDWGFWLYPATVPPDAAAGVTVTTAWSEAEARLAAGGRVVYFPPAADLDWRSPLLDKVPVFWNRLMNPGWSRMLGLLNDATHPALAGFPTDVHCDWQWTDLLARTRAINLEHLPPTLQPIVQAIDDWNRNWKLGVIFEARVGPGRLLVCSIDLVNDLAGRPAARQLRRSLLDYAAGGKFQPAAAVSAAECRALWFDTRVMTKLGARADASGSNPAAAIDGDPNTFWLVGRPARRSDAGDIPTRSGLPQPFPHALTVTFAAPVAMDGLALMPRQNDRDHSGDVRGYTVEVSDDGQQWREVARGELLSTFEPQTVRFAATVTARALRFTALSAHGRDTATALAELAVLYAGPTLPANAYGDAGYQRVRSTSADVEEAGPPR